MTLYVKKLSDKAILPTRADKYSAGLDLYSANDYVLPSRQHLLIATNIAISIPNYCYGRIAPRSGLALKYGIDVGAGVIDASYRGEIGVLLFNHSDKDYTIKYGDRIAQLIIEPTIYPPIVETAILESTERGENGFGSSGY